MVFTVGLPASAGLPPFLTPEQSARVSGNYGWNLPESFTDARLATLITRMAHATYGIGFRYLGVEPDWFHGHLIYEEVGEGADKQVRPRAILYHTQEDAHEHQWNRTPDSPYKYLNHANRNWIQWLTDSWEDDGLRIENARAYVNAHKKNPAVFLHEKPVKGERYTIHSRWLDDEKLGFRKLGEVQFEFHAICHEPVDPFYRRGPIRVKLPNGQEYCLVLKTGVFTDSHWR